MSSIYLRAAFAALVSAVISLPAVAGTLGIANDYNGFIFNNLNASGGDTEGRLAVGNNFTATSYGVGVTLTNSHGTRNDLVVGNNMNAPAWQVFNGNAVYGTTLTAAPTTPNGATFPGTPVNFAAAQADLQAKSAYWASLPATGTSVFMFTTITLTGTNPGLNVFQVNVSDWQASNNKLINIPVGSTAIINIASGASISFSGGLAINGDGSQSNPAENGVIYNFPNATSVTPSNIAVLGSLLAPYATLTLNGSSINGTGIALNAVQQSGGEFHDHPFTGNVPDPVPEPCSALLLLVGSALGLLRRRTR